MYRLTFDDKPEANTYVKWAKGHGYRVSDPQRERLAKNVKKFDLDGKRRKYQYVVWRKKGVGKEGAGKEGADVFPVALSRKTARKLMDLGYTAKEIGEFANDPQKGFAIAQAGIESPRVRRGKTEAEEQFRRAKTERTESRALAPIPKAVYYGQQKAEEHQRDYGGVITKDKDSKGRETFVVRSEEAQREYEANLERQQQVITQAPPTLKPTKKEEPQIVDRPKGSGKKQKGKTTSGLPDEMKGTIVHVVKEQTESPTVAAYRNVPLRQIKPEGAFFAPPQQAAYRSRAPTKETAPETVAKQWEERGQPLPDEQRAILERHVKKEEERRAEAEEQRKRKEAVPPESKFERAMKASAKRDEAERYGEPLPLAVQRREEEIKALKGEARAFEASEKAKQRAADEAKAEAAKEKKRQYTAYEKVKEDWLRRGQPLPKHLEQFEDTFDYKTAKKELKFKKAEKEGTKQRYKVAEAEAMRKYQQTATPVEAKAKGITSYQEAEELAKQMRAEKVKGEVKILGRTVYRPVQQRKTFILRGKKPGEYKVVAGTEKELTTPKTLKAALAAEKKKYKKRKKLLEKPLRELKRAKRVVRTTARHAARHMLRSPRDIQRFTRGKHPAIGNVTMEYRRARIATPILVPRSVAGVYST